MADSANLFDTSYISKMASEFKLFEDANKDFLTCSICKDIFKHPKQLKCMHNFCQDCLHPLLKVGTPCKIKCPLCRKEIELAVETVTKLEHNYFLSNLCELFLVANLNTVVVLCSFCSETLNKENASRCIDCSDNLCEKCAKAHTRTRFTRNHQVILISEFETGILLEKSREGNAKILCQKHPNNYLEYFCQTCQVPVCLGCTVVDHNQRGHHLLNLKDNPTTKKFKEQITQQIHKLEEMMPSFEKNIAIANEREMCLTESLEETKNGIRDTAKCLIDEIEAHTKSLIEKVDKRAEAIQKRIEHHREAAEIRLKSSAGINQFAKNLSRHGLNVEIMSSAKDLLRRMKELQEDMEDLHETGELRFIDQHEFKFGKVEKSKITVTTRHETFESKEYNYLEYCLENGAISGQYVKRGPNWPEGYDVYDHAGLYTDNTAGLIQRNEQNDVVVHFQSDLTLECKMNPGEYWLQPAHLHAGDLPLKWLERYVKYYMKVGDEVKRGLDWPAGNSSYDSVDGIGQKTGKITKINRTQGRNEVTVSFGPPVTNTVQCPMHTDVDRMNRNYEYYLLPLRSIPCITASDWVDSVVAPKIVQKVPLLQGVESRGFCSGRSRDFRGRESQDFRGRGIRRVQSLGNRIISQARRGQIHNDFRRGSTLYKGGEDW
ncbi:protein PML-like [Anneissia japonica]|uniref:protein PML-like n=1 Tax=Anneissia japonica TaxID=1529436 RepID=UPI0014257EE6|nr:protein PML-like [Anneissia japonica]